MSDIVDIESEDVELMIFSPTLARRALYRRNVHLAVSSCGQTMELWTRLLLFPEGLVSVVRGRWTLNALMQNEWLATGSDFL